MINARLVFDSALDINDPSERQAFLQNACGDDSELMTQVKTLLSAHEGIGEFLDIPAIQQILPKGESGNECTLDIFPPDSEDTETGEDSEGIAVLGLLQPSEKIGSLGTLGQYEVLKVLGQGALASC